MAGLSTLALGERFPKRELEVRRLSARDEQFRCACEDYEEAMKALRHWECVELEGHRIGNAARADEYRQLADEIAAEIDARLDAASASRGTREDNRSR